MEYEVKKVIEFGRENTKPVGLLKGAILLKDGTEQVLQLKLRNNGKDILNRVTVKITCIGKDGQTRGVQSYTYEKLFVACGEEFGSNIPITLQYSDVEQVDVKIEDDYRNLKVSSRSIQKQQKNPYNILVCIVSIVTLLAGIYSTCSMFNADFAFWYLAYPSELILNSMYLYGITQYILATSKMPLRRLYRLNLAILIISSICIVFPTVLRGVLDEPSVYFDSVGGHCSLSTRCQQVLYFINSIVMLIALSKYCNKKYFWLIILAVLIGMIPIIEMKAVFYYAHWDGEGISVALKILNSGRHLNPTHNYTKENLAILGQTVKAVLAVLGGGLVASKKFKLR